MFSNPDEGLKALKNILANHPNMPDSLLAQHYNNYGVYHGVKGNIDSSIIYFIEALELYNDHPNSLRPKLNLGIAYRNKGQFRLAIEQLLLAETEAKNQDNDLLLARTYSEIASVYSSLGFHHTSLEYAEKALELHLGVESTSQLDVKIAKQNIANKLKEFGKIRTSYQMLFETTDYFKENELWHAYFPSLISCIDAQFLLGEFNDAYTNLIENETFILEHASPLIHTHYYRLKGKILYALNRNSEADTYLYQALNNELEFPQGLLVKISTDLLVRFKLLDDPSDAVQFIEKYINIVEESESSFRDLELFYVNVAEAYAKNNQFDMSTLYTRYALRLRDIISRSDVAILRDFHPTSQQNKQYKLDNKSLEIRVEQLRNKNLLFITILSLLIVILLVSFRLKMNELKSQITQFENNSSYFDIKAKLDLANLERGKLEKKIIELEKSIVYLDNNSTNSIENNDNKNIEKTNARSQSIISIDVNKIFEGQLLEPLTKSEIQLCELIAQGLSNIEIAESLKIPVKKIISIKYTITKKLKDHDENSLEDYILKHKS